MSQLPNYAAEGRIKQVAAENGVRPECLDDIVMNFRAGRFGEAELPAKIKEWKATPDHHYFNIAGEAADKELFVKAFGEVPSITAQGAVLKKYGPERTAQIAAEFGTKIGTGKPGKTPDSFKTNGNGGDHGGNPFNKLRNADGTVNKAVEKEIGRMVTVLGKKKCEDIARAAGKTISGLPLRT
jgi:hypothetical protein